MDVIIALVFISLTLVVAGLVFFFSRLFEGDFEHGDRLSLLPLADDDGMNAEEPESEDDKPDGISYGSSGSDDYSHPDSGSGI
jgi:nitrogen fixation-related uncharacterized protein